MGVPASGKCAHRRASSRLGSSSRAASAGGQRLGDPAFQFFQQAVDDPALQREASLLAASDS